MTSETQYYIRACVMGALPSGQKLVHIQATNADGLRIYTDDNSLVTADDIIRKAGASVVREHVGCDYCQEDAEGYRKMIGPFSITNPFHGSTWQIETAHCKPRQIFFCPMCGRKLTQPPGKEGQP